MSRFRRRLGRLGPPVPGAGHTAVVEPGDAPDERHPETPPADAAERGSTPAAGLGAQPSAQPARSSARAPTPRRSLAQRAARLGGARNIDPAESDVSADDQARLARIGRLRARLDEMVNHHQARLRDAPRDAQRAARRAARARAWSILNEGESPTADEAPSRPRAPRDLTADGVVHHGGAFGVRVGPPAPIVARRDPDDFSGVPGGLEDTPDGPVHLVRARFAPDHRHGAAPIGHALEVPSTEVACFALDPGLAAIDLSQALFFDTETTGLFGSGTVPFLIGLGWFEDGQLEVRQLFLRRLGEERPMLSFLADRLARCSCVISYNGKSFDWPLIRQRFVMNRMTPPAAPVHLDLLHCARRAFKLRLGGVRLVEVEARVLGMERFEDVPGSEIPAIYLDFIRGGTAERIAGILEHNLHDIVALAALLGRLGQRFARVDPNDDPRDLLSYARIAEKAGDADRAGVFAQAAAQKATGTWAADAWLLHARLVRRRGDFAEEERALQAALAEAVDDERRGQAHLALAKLYEHRHKDFDRARSHAEHTRWIEGTPKHLKRLARLDEKSERAARRASPGSSSGSR